jgi:hypothetical protein
MTTATSRQREHSVHKLRLLPVHKERRCDEVLGCHIHRENAAVVAVDMKALGLIFPAPQLAFQNQLVHVIAVDAVAEETVGHS